MVVPAIRVALLGDLRSVDLGDLSAARGALGGVPCAAAFALGTAGFLGLSFLGVGGVSPLGVGGAPLPLLFASGLPLGLLPPLASGLASARPDLLPKKRKEIQHQIMSFPAPSPTTKIQTRSALQEIKPSKTWQQEQQVLRPMPAQHFEKNINSRGDQESLWSAESVTGSLTCSWRPALWTAAAAARMSKRGGC